MILAVDPGLATCGWAVVDSRARVVDLGVVLSKPNARLGKNDDRVVRARAQATALELVLAEHNCGVLAAEAMSFPRRVQVAAVQSICLSWGVLVGLASSWEIPIAAVQPKAWEHAVVATEGKVDYEAVSLAIVDYVARFPGPIGKLGAISKGARNHAIDAVGIGLYTALRPTKRRA